jgi:hypothetical protein
VSVICGRRTGKHDAERPRGFRDALAGSSSNGVRAVAESDACGAVADVGVSSEEKVGSHWLSSVVTRGQWRFRSGIARARDLWQKVPSSGQSLRSMLLARSRETPKPTSAAVRRFSSSYRARRRTRRISSAMLS